MRWPILFILLASSLALAQEFETEQPEAPAENTQGDLNQNNQNSTVDSYNRSTTNVGAGAGSPTPVNTAIAPSLISSGSDTCLQSRSTGLQILTLGLSRGAYKQDEECNRRRDSKLFKDLGLTIAAVSRMCQNNENWKAMFLSGTPCPILVKGKMVYGKSAVLAMRTKPELYIPGYLTDSNFYNEVLGIGEETNETSDRSDDVSISERFRTSTKSVE